MSKKLALIAAVMVCSLIGVVVADTLLIPQGSATSLATADYGGVERSTIGFSGSNALAFSGAGSVLGFVASSGTYTDYLIFRDTFSLQSSSVSAAPGFTGDLTLTDEFARVYMSTSSQLGTTYTFPAPIRVYRGLAVKSNVGTTNMVTVLWTKFGK